MAIDSLLNRPETVHKAIIVYLAYKDQVELVEAIVTFLFSAVKHPEYIPYIQDKQTFIFTLLEEQVTLYAQNREKAETVLQKVLALI